MPQPTSRDVHADIPLTNISIAYIQREENYIAGKVFPRVPVAKQSDKYWVYTKGDWFRDEARKRADATESAGSGYTVSSTATYFCDVYAFHKDIGAQTRANADGAINLDRDATQFITQRLLLRQEIDWMDSYFSTGVWTNEATPSNLWSDYSLGDPISDIEEGIETVLGETGLRPNTLTLGYRTWRYLKHHPDLVDRVKFTGGPDSDMKRAIADLFEIEMIHTTMSIKNSAAEGVTPVYGFNSGNHALLSYAPASPGLLAPTAGYNFTWTGYNGGLGTEITISRIALDHIKADRIEGEISYAFKVIGQDLAYFFAGAVST